MGKKLYVGNLPFSATDATLIEKFGAIGPVESAKIITDRDSGRSKGFGFVEMANEADAEKAIAQFNGSDYEGRPMTVSEARPQAPRDNNRRPGGGGGGFRGGRGDRDRGGGNRF